jgi:hypothetical protein
VGAESSSRLVTGRMLKSPAIVVVVAVAMDSSGSGVLGLDLDLDTEDLSFLMRYLRRHDFGVQAEP